MHILRSSKLKQKVHPLKMKKYLTSIPFIEDKIVLDVTHITSNLNIPRMNDNLFNCAIGNVWTMEYRKPHRELVLRTLQLQTNTCDCASNGFSVPVFKSLPVCVHPNPN